MADLASVDAELATRILARRHLADFTLYTYPTYIMGTFHRYMCWILEKFYHDVLAGKQPHIIISAPPRHGKSELVSVRFPAWVLGNAPDIHFIATSYSSELSSSFNKKIQELINTDAYKKLFPNIQLPTKGSRKECNSERFDILNTNGSYRSAGVGGGITGMGADILVIDDPVKDDKEALSPTIRESVYEWFRGTAYTRLAPKAGILLTMTRWHLDDLAGKLITKMKEDLNGDGDKWQVINFPAVAVNEEYIDLPQPNGEVVKTKFRSVGEPLHADRYNLKRLNRIKHTLGEFKWNAMYQQNPVAEGGNIFKRSWFKYYAQSELPGSFDILFASWDMTFKDNKKADYVVGQLWGKYGANFYLIDQIRKQMGFTETKQAVEEMYAKYPYCLTWLVEDKANGTAIIDVLRDSVPGVISINPHESKIARAAAITSLVEAGNIILPYPEDVPWVNQFIDECIIFPSGAHDDQVDAMSQGINWCYKTDINIWTMIGEERAAYV